MDTALVVAAGVLVALVAFRRVRRVRTPEARRVVVGQARGVRARRALTTLLAAARAGVGVAALVAIVWLARRLFE